MLFTCLLLVDHCPEPNVLRTGFSSSRRRNHVLATVYMARSDVAYTVRTGAAAWCSFA